MPKVILTYKGICLNYGENLVLKNIAGDIEAGRLYVVSGDNGAGKTSLLNILSGKIAPRRGEIGGSKFKSEFISSLIGKSALYSYLSVRENLEIFCKGNGSEVLLQNNLLKYQEALVKDLSQGYAQRVALSIVLSSRSDLIFIDEPTNFLDKSAKEALIKDVSNVLIGGSAVIVSSHEPDIFSKLEPVSLVLRDGSYV